ncbi:unnamed protein product [Paramecium sonneborni]|uniref:Transmembrane protein n=1 Tax=Paramecium sonneborni TaxID=65129 RepID=A0A8S1R8J3_9CILI|nr:unnamed protein product [Paramecium sonneborni]
MASSCYRRYKELSGPINWIQFYMETEAKQYVICVKGHHGLVIQIDETTILDIETEKLFGINFQQQKKEFLNNNKLKLIRFLQNHGLLILKNLLLIIKIQQIKIHYYEQIQNENMHLVFEEMIVKIILGFQILGIFSIILPNRHSYGYIGKLTEDF